MRALTAVSISAGLAISGLAPSPAVAAAPAAPRLSVFVNPRTAAVGDEVMVSGMLSRKVRGDRWAGWGSKTGAPCDH